MAGIGLWVVARTDSELRAALVAAERKALRDRKRVLDDIFAPMRDVPAYGLVVNTSLEFVRGLAVSGILRSDPESTAALVQQWIWAIKQLLVLAPHRTQLKRMGGLGVMDERGYSAGHPSSLTGTQEQNRLRSP